MQRAILNGDDVTGVTIMYMDKGMDTGDMILKKSMAIEESDRFPDVHDKMAKLSCECIMEALGQIEAGTNLREPQNNKEATYAPMLTKEDGRVDWNSPTAKIINQVRALDPWPGTYTYHGGHQLKIWECSAWQLKKPCGLLPRPDTKPGEVLEAGPHLLVKTGDGALAITMLQGQGGKRMKSADYLRGHDIELGTILGQDFGPQGEA